MSLSENRIPSNPWFINIVIWGYTLFSDRPTCFINESPARTGSFQTINPARQDNLFHITKSMQTAAPLTECLPLLTSKLSKPLVQFSMFRGLRPVPAGLGAASANLAFHVGKATSNAAGFCKEWRIPAPAPCDGYRSVHACSCRATS